MEKESHMIFSTTARLLASSLPLVMLIGCSDATSPGSDLGLGNSPSPDLSTPGIGGGGGTDAGTNPNAGPPPAPAAAVGYDTLTFGPQINVGTTASPTTSYPQLTNGANWAPFTFYGTSWKSLGVKQNADGSVTLDGSGEAFGNGLSSAVAGNPGANTAWKGIAFGGGAYFEAVMAFTGPASFWANDIETMNGVSIGAGPHPWPGQAAGYGDWMECDFAEFDSTNVYGFALHNWYSQVGSNVGTSSIGSGSPATVPGADYTKPNKYGFLWVPATDTSQGYAKFFFNGQQVGNTMTWNKYDATLPPSPEDKGTGGSSAYSVLDKLHLALILGGSTGSTNTIYSVSVWQRSAADNLVQQ
jgi:hypothetical protein